MRGPLNGGKDECLIVDVRDNIERFDGTFAYDNVGHLWDNDVREETMDADTWAALVAERPADRAVALARLRVERGKRSTIVSDCATN